MMMISTSRTKKTGENMLRKLRTMKRKNFEGKCDTN